MEDDAIEELKKDGDDTKDIANRLQWIACKDQFFSSILIADDYFYSATLKSKMGQEGSSYLKDCHSTMSVNFDPKGEIKTGFRYYFGANKYKILPAIREPLPFSHCALFHESFLLWRRKNLFYQTTLLRC